MITTTPPMSQQWEIVVEQGGAGFTVRPKGTQMTEQLFPIYSNPISLREWLTSNGFEIVNGDPDLWSKNGR